MRPKPDGDVDRSGWMDTREAHWMDPSESFESVNLSRRSLHYILDIHAKLNDIEVSPVLEHIVFSGEWPSQTESLIGCS
jgi:hypothetical protein